MVGDWQVFGIKLKILVVEDFELIYTCLGKGDETFINFIEQSKIMMVHT